MQMRRAHDSRPVGGDHGSEELYMAVYAIKALSSLC